MLALADRVAIMHDFRIVDEVFNDGGANMAERILQVIHSSDTPT